MIVFKRIIFTAGLLLAMLLLVAYRPVVAASCADCHKAKSRAYQHCRSIPPTDREARSRCFKKADRELESCLKSCK